MDIIEHAQGSAAWLAHRATHFNASDAPAMMGCSPYKTRTQLIHEVHTGLTPDVDAATQRRFDDGHRFEALARPLAEEILGEDLYPVVGTKGKLSASFDGLTFDERIGFEHKTLNDQLRAALMSDAGADALPLAYRVQMEQQCMVSGASRILFMASKWAGEELVEELHAWYEPDAELRAAILSGWEQFEADVAAYVPKAANVAVSAAPMASLPAVSVRMDGQLAVASNLPEFGTALRAFIGRMVPKPATDQEFADAEAECKALKKAEDALDGAENSALAELSDVEAMRRTVADLRTLARKTRLDREKLVAAEKENRRLAIVQGAVKAHAAHIAALNQRLGRPYMPALPVDFAGAIKGKKNLDSMQDAVDSLLAQSKIAASGWADRIDVNLKHLAVEAGDFVALFPDVATLVTKAADDFTALVQYRVSEQRAKDRKRAEELAEQERERIRQEERDRAQREEAARAAVAVQTPSPVVSTEPATPVESPATVTTAPAPAVYQLPARAAAPAADTGVATLLIGGINRRLGYDVNAVFLKQLGFEPARIDGARRFYRDSDLPLIGRAIAEHTIRVTQLQAAAA